jgi:hypothetical protein
MKKFFDDVMSLKKVYPWTMNRQDAVQWHRIDSRQIIELPLPLRLYPLKPSMTKMAILGEVHALHKKRC